jgi:hypothetical protein
MLNNLITNNDFNVHPIYLSLDPFGGVEHLTNIITTYQPIILTDLLGEQLYNELIADCTNGVPVTQKWKDFLDGKMWTEDGKTYVYKGFADLMKYFMFYYFLQDSNTMTNFQGNTEINIENFNLKSYARKIPHVWNLGVDIYNGILQDFMAKYFSELEFKEKKTMNHMGF